MEERVTSGGTGGGAAGDGGSTRRAVRVCHGGSAARGQLAGDAIRLDDGTEIPEATAEYLAPVDQPSKILAVHLTYRSRVEEYAAKLPPEPNYFLKPPNTLNG